MPPVPSTSGRSAAEANPDIVIIGAGAAGCVLAERLSADPACRVMLIEAGTGRRPKEVRIPAAFAKLIDGPLDWGYRTAPQPGLGSRTLMWPRGKTVGGSAAINAQVWTHAEPGDVERWRSVAPETFAADAVATARRRVDAAMSPDVLRDPNALSSAFLTSCSQLGIRVTGDINDELGGDRAASSPVMQRRGLRRSPREAVLDPARRRPNLEVVADALVERIVIEQGRATGVEVVVGGRRRSVRAAAGVVVAAGSIGSPHMLQLSGIGPVGPLTAAGVRPLVDLPAVGAHLQDHLMSIVVAGTDGRVRTLKDAERPSQLLSLLVRRRGMLTSNVAEAAAFVRTSPGLAAADIELLFAPVMFLDHGQVAPPAHGASIGTVLLHPESEGTVMLRTADAAEAPVVDPRYLTDPGQRDLATLTDGVERAIEVLRSQPLAAHVTGFHEPDRLSRRDLEAFVRREAETVYHPVGTCRMGTSVDTSVVDAGFGVHGVDALWVADASVFPAIPGCHPTAPTMVLADLAATHILAAVEPHAGAGRVPAAS